VELQIKSSVYNVLCVGKNSLGSWSNILNKWKTFSKNSWKTVYFKPVVLNLSIHSYPRELSLYFLVPLVWNQIVIDTNTISLQRYNNTMNLQ